jgi:hypothetical protein
MPPPKLALSVYPEAQVRVDDKRGITLYPSAPPVAERKLQVPELLDSTTGSARAVAATIEPLGRQGSTPYPQQLRSLDNLNRKADKLELPQL